jgi:hypothetical protein
LKQITLEQLQRYFEMSRGQEKMSAKLENTARALLGMGYEVTVTKGLHEIVDELRLMSRVFLDQKQVTKDFVEHLNFIYQERQEDAGQRTVNEELLDVVKGLKELLEQNLNMQAHLTMEQPASEKLEVMEGVLRGSTDLPLPLSKTSLTLKTIQRASQLPVDMETRRNRLGDLENTANNLLDQICDSQTIPSCQGEV